MFCEEADLRADGNVLQCAGEDACLFIISDTAAGCFRQTGTAGIYGGMIRAVLYTVQLNDICTFLGN